MPDRNMAVDAALLDEVRDVPEALPVVRVYRWDRPCVSFGRLQDEAEVRAAYPGLPLVRRPTGGRAVRHGDDLTFSVAARLDDLPLTGGSGVLLTYRLIAGGLVDALWALGVSAEFGRMAQAGGQASPVDCFQSTARCDIVDSVTGAKLIGCAQRRDGPALLQQMSLPTANLPAHVLEDELVEAVRGFLAARLAVSAWIV